MERSIVCRIYSVGYDKHFAVSIRRDDASHSYAQRLGSPSSVRLFTLKGHDNRALLRPFPFETMVVPRC